MKTTLVLILILFNLTVFSQENLDTIKIEKSFNWNDSSGTWEYRGFRITVENKNYERISSKFITDSLDRIEKEIYKTENRIDSIISYVNSFQLHKEIYINENTRNIRTFRLNKRANKFRLESDVVQTLIGGDYCSTGKRYVKKSAHDSHLPKERVRGFSYCNDQLIAKYSINRFNLKSYKQIERRFVNSIQKLIKKTETRVKGKDTTYFCITEYQYKDSLLKKITYTTRQGTKYFFDNHLSYSETNYSYEKGLLISESYSQNDPDNSSLKMKRVVNYKYDDRSRLIEVIEKRPNESKKEEFRNCTKMETQYYRN